MRRLICPIAACCFFFCRWATAEQPSLDLLLQEFQSHSGARLVFTRNDLPPGRYHDVLKPLGQTRRAKAAAICLAEARKYPRGYFADIGLEAIGVFAACASKQGDGFRPFDKQLGGYRYFGVYNRADAVAASYYSDGQLELTFHHETFHHVDATQDGRTESWLLSSDDAIYQAAITGKRPYAAPTISKEDLAALKKRCIGLKLKDTVSAYAAKNPREDQAETARHLMSALPDALVQVVEHPQWAGSQRILHVLSQFEQSSSSGPDFQYFVDVALDRVPHTLDEIQVRLRAYAGGGGNGFHSAGGDPKGARATLQALARLDANEIPADDAAELVELAAKVTQELLRQRIRPDLRQQRFTIWGREDNNGVNWTLRDDIQQFGSDAVTLRKIALLDRRASDLPVRTQMQNLRLIARYYSYIAGGWTVTPGTQKAFESSRDLISASLPVKLASLGKTLRQTDLAELATRIGKDGEPRLLPKP